MSLMIASKKIIDHINLGRLFENQKNETELWVSYDDAHTNKIVDERIAEALTNFISKGTKIMIKNSYTDINITLLLHP